MNMLFIPVFSLIGEAFIALLMVIDTWVYNLVSSSYKIFMALSGARLLSSDAFASIANKLYIIVGVVMLFVLSYAIIKAIIDPDQMTKGELGGPKIIKSVMVAVIGLGIAPVIFNMMYQAQGIILENNVLGKIFFRTDDNAFKLSDTQYTDSEGNVIDVAFKENEIVPDDVLYKNGGSLVGTYIFQAFFYPSSGNMEDAKTIESAAKDYFVNNNLLGLGCGLAAGAAILSLATGPVGWGLGIAAAIGGAASFSACRNVGSAADDVYADVIGEKISLEEAYVYSAQTGDFGIYTNFLDEVSGDENKISYVVVISTIVGGIVLYAFISFSIDMGVRCAKLAYYQIIAPIPLILQVLPKFKDSFNKYVQSVLSTFLEVFIRISVVYVVVYIICHLTDMFSTEGVWKNLGAVEYLFARVLLDVGLVIFAKQAPKMIQETFGIQSGSMSLGIRNKLADGGLLVAGAVIGGAATAGVRGFTDAWKNRGEGRGNVINGFAKGVGQGALSAVSGGIRAGYNGRDAKAYRDVVTAASTGARKATLAREARQKYYRDHGNTLLDIDNDGEIIGVIPGKVKDAKNRIMRWAGFNNLESIQAERTRLESILKAESDMKDTVKALVNKHVTNDPSKEYGITTRFDGSKLPFAAEIRNGDFGGIGGTLKPSILREIDDTIKKMELDQKTEIEVNGHNYTASQLQRLRGMYEKQLVNGVCDQLLLSDESWDALKNRTITIEGRTVSGSDVVNNLVEVRPSANTYRSVIYDNITIPEIGMANDKTTNPNLRISAANFAKKNLIISEGALKELGDVLKDSVELLQREESKIKQKESKDDKK